MGRPDLTARLGPLVLANPVMTASGTCGYGRELQRWCDLSRFGAVILKGLSMEPRDGNPPPRVAETASGLLNSIGLANIGVRAFIDRVLPELRGTGAVLIANLYATTVDEFSRAARSLEQAGGIAALELNLSCPNVNSGGISFGQDPCQAAMVVHTVRKSVSLPLMVKLTPKVADIAAPARACQEAGADIISLPNTFPGMAIDLATRRPLLGANFGGLSGPAIKPLALKLVWEACRAVTIPVVGMGGISSWRDAAEFIVAGASAVQVGTATLTDPGVGPSIIDGLGYFLTAEGLADLEALRGSLRLNPTEG